MHDYDDEPGGFQTEVQRVYRATVAHAGLDGTLRQPAITAATEELLDMHARGELKVPVEDAIRAALTRADVSDGRLTDRVLRAASRGEFALTEDGDPMLDIVVTLGSGLRKQWRFVTRADLMTMDAERYRNVRNVQTAYDEWRSMYDVWLPVLDRHGSFGDAVESGDLPDPGKHSGGAA